MDVMLILCLMAFLSVSDALRCYTCSNAETSSSLFKGRADTNAQCGSPSILSDLESSTCDAGELCGFIEGSANFLLFTTKVQVRGCMPAPEPNLLIPKCYEDSNDVLKAARKVLKEMKGFDGRVCFCSTELCSAGGCGDDKVDIFGYCLEWYYWALLAVGGVIGLFLITCCCCCCCCCCRKKSRGVVVQQLTPGPAVVVTSSNGIQGMENPGYGQMQSTAYVPMVEK